MIRTTPLLYFVNGAIEIEKPFSMSSFLHGIGAINQDADAKSVFVAASGTIHNSCIGIRFETCGNGTK